MEAAGRWSSAAGTTTADRSEVLQDGVGGAAAGGEGAVDGGVVAVVAEDLLTLRLRERPEG